MNYKKWWVCLCLCLCLLPMSAYAHANTHELSTPVLYETQDEEDGGSDFIGEALQSLEEHVAQQEANENYIVNFYHSSQTATSKSFNLFDWESYIMAPMNLLILMIEMIGILISFFVMITYNVVSSSFLDSLVGTVIEGIERTMFDWSDMNSWVIKVVVIATIIGIAYRLIKDFTRFRGYKQIFQVILSAMVSMSFIIFIGQNGRNIIGALEDTMQTMIVETFIYDDQTKDIEIVNKENIFNTMQLQPFMLRHFGTTSYQKIADNADQSIDEAKVRVQKLLDDPSKDNAEYEHEEMNNQAIAHDLTSTCVIIFYSMIMLVHRVLIGMVIAVICIAVGAVKLLKELLLWLSVYQLIWWLIKRTGKARQWFSDRLMWSILAIGADILFSSALFFVMQICASISAIHPLFLIAFDVLLLLLVKYASQHLDQIGTWLKDEGGHAVQAMLTGSVQEGLRNHKGGQEPFDNNDSSRNRDDDELNSDESLSDAYDHTDINGEEEDLSDHHEANLPKEEEGFESESDQEDLIEEAPMMQEDTLDAQAKDETKMLDQDDQSNQENQEEEIEADPDAHQADTEQENELEEPEETAQIDDDEKLYDKEDDLAGDDVEMQDNAPDEQASNDELQMENETDAETPEAITSVEHSEQISDIDMQNDEQAKESQDSDWNGMDKEDEDDEMAA